MMNVRPPKALIIGGSLGGLFAATTLRAIGWDVHVFERSAHDLDSRGGGVVLQPEVTMAFDQAGLEYPNPLGVATGDRIYLDESDAVVHRTYMPQTQTSWNMLYSVMKRALPKKLVSPGERFVKFEQNGDGVTAYFESGRVETGDLLIGADGARSTVRGQVLPDLHPRYAGYVAWRGLVPENELSQRAAEKMAGTFAFQQGDATMLLQYMVPGEDESTEEGRRRWNWVWYRKVAEGEHLEHVFTDKDGRRHEYSLPPGSVSDEYVRDLNATASEILAPTFQDLVAATKEPFVQAILDLQTPQMVFGRVILVGDAAFVPRPHTAGSTAKAAANALSLAKALEPIGSDIDESLKDWEVWELRNGIGMTERGMATGDSIMSIPRQRAK